MSIYGIGLSKSLYNTALVANQETKRRSKTPVVKPSGIRKLTDDDVRAMRSKAKFMTTDAVKAAYPHISGDYILKILSGEARNRVI